MQRSEVPPVSGVVRVNNYQCETACFEDETGVKYVSIFAEKQNVSCMYESVCCFLVHVIC